jgi:L-threonate 2-dehydrogenase
MAAAPVGPVGAPAAAPVIGVVGCGLMGSAILARLLQRGHSVAAFDIDAQRLGAAQAQGARACDSAAAVARVAAALLVVVVDAAQTEQVLWGRDGAAAALRAGSAVLLCPTIGPADVERFAARLVAVGIEVLDAPMSGGPQRARAGTMSLMVACADAVFARWQPLLADMASRLFHVSQRPGDGARTKLVNNLLAAINLAGAAEALALADRLGLDGAQTLAVIERSSGQSWIGVERMRRALAGDTTITAQLSLLAKDSQLALREAAQVVQPVPVGTAAAARFAAGLEQGFAAVDDSLLLQLALLPGLRA